MAKETPLTKSQMTLALLSVLAGDVFVFRGSYSLLQAELRPAALWAVLGWMLAVQLGAVYLVRRPTPLVNSIRREQLLLNLLGYGFLPAWCLVLLLNMALVSMLGEVSKFVLMICMLAAFTVTPPAVLIYFLSRYRIPYYAGRCTRCLYDLSAVEADACPECNMPITRSEDPST